MLSNSEVEDALGAKAIAELMMEVDSCLAIPWQLLQAYNQPNLLTYIILHQSCAKTVWRASAYQPAHAEVMAMAS